MGAAGECIAAVIRDNETGELRLFQMRDYDAERGEPFSEYIWAEGNYSCDCNRSIFFREAIGEECYPDEDCACGEERYTVLGIFQRGRLVYAEPDGRPNPHS